MPGKLILPADNRGTRKRSASVGWERNKQAMRASPVETILILMVCWWGAGLRGPGSLLEAGEPAHSEMTVVPPIGFENPELVPIQPAPPLRVGPLISATDDPATQVYEMHALHNETRHALHLPLLGLNEQLCDIAAAYAETLGQTGQLDHYADGSVQLRLARAGYRFSQCGENLAWSGPLWKMPTTMATFRHWQASPKHWRKVVSTTYREIGVAKRGAVWVVIFAAPL
jgi:uncharacterized protein YkwD